MRLANDNFCLSIGSRRFTLRPTLRAAFHLEAKYEGLQNLANAIVGGSHTACCDLISTACTDQKAWLAYAVTGDLKPLADLFETRKQLLLFVRRLAGDDPGREQKPQEGEPIAAEEYYTRLFQIATGWLGWTPEQAWNATPAEIINAKTGRNEMLAALFGSGKPSDGKPVDLQNADTRAELNKLGDLSVTRIGAQ